MIEDKLSRDERIRLECLRLGNTPDTSANQIIEMAHRFENYIKGGN